MGERPYKCPACYGSFRTESGMMIHLGRQHEAPQALEALGKNYEMKLERQQKENASQGIEISDLKTKLAERDKDLIIANMRNTILNEENIKLMLEMRKMFDERGKLIIGYVARDYVLQERFGVKLPNPFEETEIKPKNETKQ